MQTGSWVAIYFVIWWVTLFAVLPFGVRSQREAGEVVRGTDPRRPRQIAASVVCNCEFAGGRRSFRAVSVCCLPDDVGDLTL